MTRIALNDSSTLRMTKRGNCLVCDDKTSEILHKRVITWEQFEFGISQRLVKQGYRIAIQGG
jgi:hypothetical protein